MDRRNTFLYWWPVTARVLGMGFGLYEMLTGINDPAVLGFAGGLVIAPVITDHQRRRNSKRLAAEDEA